MAKKDKITAKQVMGGLWHFFDNCDYKLFNSYVFGWESDFFCMQKSSGYMYEVEVKVTKSDFKADLKKADKHELLSLHKSPVLTKKTSIRGHVVRDGKYVQDYSGVNYVKPNLMIPNRFYYAVPENLISISDLPPYAGLLYFGRGHIRKIKEAPVLHKNNLLLIKKQTLLDKFYYLSLNKNRELRLLKEWHKNLKEDRDDLYNILKQNNISRLTGKPESVAQDSAAQTKNI